jgi:mono/diheme cytochrome c family protein
MISLPLSGDWFLARVLPGIAAAVVGGWMATSSWAGPVQSARMLEEANCIACHAPSASQSEWLVPKAAPQWKELGDRVSPAWVKAFLTDPRATHPGTAMPDILHGLSSESRAEAAEALTHFLMSDRPQGFLPVLPDRAAVARGEGLFHRVGCVACHPPQDGAAPAAGSVPLPAMADKWSLEGLQRFLLDPKSVRPSGRMPSLNLSEPEARDVAHYLLRETRVPAALEVAHYRDRLESLEDLDAATPFRTGPATNLSMAAAGPGAGRAVRFSGWFEIPRAGRYTFYLVADGACRLSIADGWRLGMDSWQRERVEASTPMRLDPGWYPLVLDHVRRGPKEPSFRLEWEGPGIPREVFAASRLRATREAVPEPVLFRQNPSLAEKGKGHAVALGCASCHQPEPGQAPGRPLMSLDPARGCLAENPPARSPDFGLDAARRDAFRAALADLNRPALPKPSERDQVAHTMAAFRCTACHVRDATGGVDAARNAYFTSNGEDLGDEGRVPPSLDGVGDRLRPEWIVRVLAQGAPVRPYLNTRMPRFSHEAVTRLAPLFVTLDRQEEPVAPTKDSPEDQREAGRRLVGTDGLSCIACHRFNRQPAHALQVMDLAAAVTGRLNEDWFRRFLRNPERFHPGTRMPAFWPDGVSPLPDLLGGSVDRQHAAIWTYLADGPRAKFPAGLSRENMELVVGGEPVVYRGKLWEAGFRAVAVGFPGELNAAFDAEEMRLALLWRGRFLNAGPHWGVQGMGQIRPLGSPLLILPKGPAFAVLPSFQTRWPTNSAREQGIRFAGYQLDPQKRPILLYRIGSLEVDDRIVPFSEGGRSGLHRTLRFSGTAPEGLYLRVAAGDLRSRPESGWELPGQYTIERQGTWQANFVGEGNYHELRISVQTHDGVGQLEFNYVW